MTPFLPCENQGAFANKLKFLIVRFNFESDENIIGNKENAFSVFPTMFSKPCSKSLTHSHTMTPFDIPGETSLLKTLWAKEKLLVTSNFSFSPSVFYPSG